VIKEGYESGLARQGSEIVVVGGSAAGFYAATQLVRGGRSVRLLESKSTLDPTPRTLIVTDHFRRQVNGASGPSIVNSIRRFELFTNGRSATISLNEPDLIIERARLIRALAEEATSAGVRIDYDTRFLGLEPNGRGLFVEVDQGGRREQSTRGAWWEPTERRAAWRARPGGRRSKRCRSFKRS